MKNMKLSINLIKKLNTVALISVILILVTGCVSHIKELREAQNQINSAASLENQLKVDLFATDAIAKSNQANVSYRMAQNILSNLINEKKEDLEKDNLLGSVYTLKAITEWRLGDYNTAVDTLVTIKSNSNIKLYPRDLAMTEALRGLIKNDQAYQHMLDLDYKYEDIKTLLRDSINDINSGIGVVQEGNNVRIYLAMAKLAALKNWVDLFNEPKKYALEVPTPFNSDAEQTTWCISANPAWSLFEGEMERLGTQEAMVSKKWWGDRLGLPQACQ
ncbi:MAG: hypothetical protein ACE5GV_00490 [Candidatus Scalindua sp.]